MGVLTPPRLGTPLVTHTHAKDQGQRSVGSKERVETDGQTDGGNCIASRTNTVGKKLGLQPLPNYGFTLTTDMSSEFNHLPAANRI